MNRTVDTTQAGAAQMPSRNRRANFGASPVAARHPQGGVKRRSATRDMKLSEFIENLKRWEAEASQEEFEALRVVCKALVSGGDPSKEITRLVGEGRAAVFLRAFEECLAVRAAR